MGRTTVSHDIFASAVGAMNSGDDHGIFCLSNDFCPYFTTTFPFPPLPKTLRVYELVVRYPSKKGVSSSVKNQEQRGVP
jgi:hypothetical protein